jgi:hypothetical protein
MKYDDMKEIGKVQIVGSTRSYKHPIFSTFESRNVFIEGRSIYTKQLVLVTVGLLKNKGF